MKKTETSALENIIERVPYYIFWKDKQFVYLGCNQRFARLVGKSSADEVIGKTDYDLNWTKSEVAFFQQGDLEVMSGTPKINQEEILIRPDNSKVVMLVSKVPLRDKFDNCIGILGMSTDITELKKIEENLKIAKEKAESSSRAKTEFISNMSHDIRTPLSGIIGMASALELNAKTDKERKYANMLCQAGNQLLKLLNSILSIVSIEHTQESDIYQEKFDLRASLDSLRALLLPSFTEKKLELIIKVDSHLPKWVINDRIKIERILLNLITNSIKFTHQGKIEVHVNVLSKEIQKVALEFIISDTGIGIAADHLPKIFERFSRVNPAYEGVYEGYGIGLYNVQKFVFLLGGKIIVKSQLNQGSVFCFNLSMPYEDEEQVLEIIKAKPIPLSSSELSLANTEKPCVLLVEDDVIATYVAKNFLELVGFEVKSVENGEAAFKHAKTERFSLILTDIGLPGMNGDEWTAAYRHWEWASNQKVVPIVGLTAHATEKAEEDCLAAGMNKVLVKPLTIEMAEELYKEAVLQLRK